MVRRHVHAAITAGLAAALISGGLPMQAIADSLGVEGESTAAAAPQPDQAQAPAEQAAPHISEAGPVVPEVVPDAALDADAGAADDGSHAVPVDPAPHAGESLPSAGVQGQPSAPVDPSGAHAEPAPETRAGNFTVTDSLYITKWVDAGETIDYVLPRELHIRNDDNTAETIPVTWEVDPYYGMEPSSVVIENGVAKGLAAGSTYFVTTVKDRQVKLSVEVMTRSETDSPGSIQSVEDIVEVIYTTDYADPSKEFTLWDVEATLSDGSHTWLNVTWDEIPRELYDGDEDAGEFTVNGVSERYGNYPVQAKVIVAVPREQSNELEISVPAGTIPDLPKTVLCDFSNGQLQNVPAEWEMPSMDHFDKDGIVYVWGAIPGSSLKAQAKVKVETIAEVQEISQLHTLVNCPIESYDLPDAYVTFADGLRASVPVKWEPIDPAQYANSGTIEMRGKIKYHDIEVSTSIRVYDDVLNHVLEERVPVGEGDKYEISNEGFYLTQDYRKWFNVAWNKGDLEALDYSAPGTYVLHGAIEGANIPVEKHVTVVGIDHIKPLAAVKTLEGVMPELPGSVEVVYTDGTVEQAYPNWDHILPSAYQHEGTFKAKGWVHFNSGSIEVTCPVTVLKAQAPASVDAVTLIGKRPELPRNVRVTMWDGTIVTSPVQWENADPQDFGKAGTFDVNGYLLGSKTRIVAHVTAMGLKDDLACKTGYYPGAPATLPQYANLKLENGDRFYPESIVWDQFPQDLLNGKEGVYEIGGTIAETPVRVKALVTTGALEGVWVSFNEFVPKGSQITLPDTATGYFPDGTDCDGIPITWDEYDHAPTQSFVAVGHVSGYAEPVRLEVHVIEEPVFKFSTMHIKKGYDATEHLPEYAFACVETEDGGFIEGGDRCPVTWDTSGVDWNKSGEISGLAHATQIGYGKDVPVTIAYEVRDSFVIDDGLEIWTEPGVEPALQGVRVQISSDSFRYVYPTWDEIDPSAYAKAGSTFTVHGFVEEMGIDVEATVHVADVASIEIPECVSTTSGSYPSLPNDVPVHWTDGGTSTEYVNWDSIPGSAYTGEAGKTTTVYGCVGSYGDYEGRRVSTKIVIVGPTQAFDNGELDVTTHVGMRPILPASLMARMTDDTVSSAQVEWDPIPEERYAQSGSFEVTGRIEGYSADAGSFLMRLFDGDVNISPEGVVTATVTVLPKDAEPVRGNPAPFSVTAVAGVPDEQMLPDKVFVPKSNAGLVGGSDDDFFDVEWDMSGVNTKEPGTYRVTGKVKGIECRAAVAYINIASAQHAIKSVVPLEMTVNVGAKPSDVDLALLREVTAVYTDGSEGVVEVEAWNMTPVTGDALSKPGDIEITGKLVGETVPASAVIHVVEDASQVPVEAAAIDDISIPEGTSFKALISKLPAKAQVIMKDGSTKVFDVTWDKPLSVGKAGSGHVISGITSNGLKVQVKVVVTGKTPAASVTVSGQGVQNGAAGLQVGETLKLSYSVAPEGADAAVTWSSSNESVATVADNGLVSAVSAGTTTVTVASKANPEVRASVVVTVVGETPEGPVVPEKPVDPEKPTEPEKPVDPDGPQTPAGPATPQEPAKPGSGSAATGKPASNAGKQDAGTEANKLAATGDPATGMIGVLGGGGLAVLIAGLRNRRRRS